MKVKITYRVDDMKQALVLLADHTYWIVRVEIEE